MKQLTGNIDGHKEIEKERRRGVTLGETERERRPLRATLDVLGSDVLLTNDDALNYE